MCAARDAALEAGQTLVTTDFVVDETLTLIRFASASWLLTPGGNRSIEARGSAGSASTATGSRRRAHVFFQYRDKDFSFTDCTSFVVMRELRLTHRDDHRPPFSADGVSGAAGRAPPGETSDAVRSGCRSAWWSKRVRCVFVRVERREPDDSVLWNRYTIRVHDRPTELAVCLTLPTPVDRRSMLARTQRRILSMGRHHRIDKLVAPEAEPSGHAKTVAVRSRC